MAEKRITNAQWWQFGERRSAVAALAELELTDDLENLTRQTADKLLCEEFANLRANLAPDRNPFHPDALAGISELTEPAALAASSRERSQRWYPSVGEPRWGEDHRIAPLLTGERVDSVVRDEIERRQKVANDPLFYFLRGVTRHDQPAVTVQHAASGLRGTFVDLDGISGQVNSKSYNIGSVDPAHPGDTAASWRAYAGLGIGRRLYTAAGSLMPHLRWRQGTVSTYATALRARLHADDPYRWNTTCEWCRTNIASWIAADPSMFAEHPGEHFDRPPITLVDAAAR